MATTTHADEQMLDREVRDSMRVIQKQRNTKLFLVLGGIIVGLAVLMAATYAQYNDNITVEPTPITQ